MGHNENVVSAWRGVCDVPHRIGENVPDTLYVEALLNPVDAKADNIYTVGSGSLHRYHGISDYHSVLPTKFFNKLGRYTVGGGFLFRSV